MKRMILTHRENKRFSVGYSLELIRKVKHGRYKDFYTNEDIRRNDKRPKDSVLIIEFNNDSVASFGDEYEVTFE